MDGRPRVLLVSEHAETRRRCEQALEATCLVRTLAPDGPELDAECRRAALVLYDFADAERDGPGLQALDEGCTAPILAIVDNASDGRLTAALESGADDFVRRDVDPSELAARVRARVDPRSRGSRADLEPT